MLFTFKTGENGTYISWFCNPKLTLLKSKLYAEDGLPNLSFVRVAPITFPLRLLPLRSLALLLKIYKSYWY